MLLRFAPGATAVPVATYPRAAAEVPQEFVAVTVAVWETPFVRPVNCELVAAELTERQVALRQTVYPVMDDPPVPVEPLQPTVTVVFPMVITTGVGAEGTVTGVIDVVPAVEFPAALIATTEGEYAVLVTPVKVAVSAEAPRF